MKNNKTYTPYKNIRGEGSEALINIYEKNYIRLQKIFPILENKENYNFLLPEGRKYSKVQISLTKASRYTTFVHIKQSANSKFREIKTEIEIASYHDIKMAEVTSFNGKKIFWVKYKYPNKNMFSKNEKIQANLFLSEWLNFSKKEGLGDILVEII